MRPFIRLRSVALPAIMIGLWLGGGSAQEQTPRHRTLTSTIAGVAIDRGLREYDTRVMPAVGRRETLEKSTAGSSHLRGSVIARFRAGTSAGARAAILAMIGGTATPALPSADFDIVALAADADVEAVARRLNLQADVEFSQARYRVHPRFVPNDPLYSRQWNFPALDMERAWDINPGATTDVIVAVLDSGLAYRSAMLTYTAVAFRPQPGGPVYPALGPINVPFTAAPDLCGTDQLTCGNRIVAPRDFIWNDNLPLDLDGHGTHVAGTIGQLTNNATGVAGMAFNVRLMPVKVLDSTWDEAFDSPFIGTDDTVARGVRYAVDNGARVINMSLGRNDPAPAPAVEAALNYAVSRGVFVAVAGGNDFLDGNPTERLAELGARIRGVVSVGAVGRDLARAAYSSTGPYVEVTAPGGDVSRGGTTSMILQQTLDLDLVDTVSGGVGRYRAPRFDSFGYYFTQGTSMAAPHVAGLAALLMQQGITNPAAIEAAMERFATDLGPAGRDDEYGYGLINPRATLRGLGVAK